MDDLPEMTIRQANALALFVHKAAPVILSGIVASDQWPIEGGIESAIDQAERLFFKMVERYKDALLDPSR